MHEVRSKEILRGGGLTSFLRKHKKKVLAGLGGAALVAAALFGRQHLKNGVGKAADFMKPATSMLSSGASTLKSTLEPLAPVAGALSTAATAYSTVKTLQGAVSDIAGDDGYEYEYVPPDESGEGLWSSIKKHKKKILGGLAGAAALGGLADGVKHQTRIHMHNKQHGAQWNWIPSSEVSRVIALRDNQYV
jgi:hypothetical protein